MKLFLKPLILSLAVVFAFSCEDPVELPSRFQQPELVVDAWLTNRAEPQTIVLTETQDFYENRLPTPVADATVAVCIDNNVADCRLFQYTDNGRYVWTPEPGDSLGPVGTEFALGIQRGETQYLAQTRVYRTAIIDSLSFQEEEESLGVDEGLYAQIYARDQVGVGDAYWIRTSYNDTLLLRPSELTVSYDGVFVPGTGADGITFVYPMRVRVNRTDDDGLPQPLVSGQEIKVEIWSLSDEAFLYLSIAQEQMLNGEAGIFALPVTNSPSNILNLTTEEPGIGFFNVSAVATVSRTVE